MEDKIQLTRVIKDCEDLALFEQEAVQIILDYKWNTYAYNFFLVKLVIYFIFLLFLYIDLDSLNTYQDEGHLRNKGTVFIVCKTVCLSIQLWFLKYEVT